MESNAPKPMNAAVRCDGCREFDSDCSRCRSRRMNRIMATMERVQQLIHLTREEVTFIKDETGNTDYPIDLVSDTEDDDLHALDELHDADAALDDDESDDDKNEDFFIETLIKKMRKKGLHTCKHFKCVCIPCKFKVDNMPEQFVRPPWARDKPLSL